MKSFFGSGPRNKEPDANQVDNRPNPSTVPLIGPTVVVSKFVMFNGSGVCFAVIHDAKEGSDKSYGMAAQRRRNIFYYDTSTGESWFLLPDNSRIIEKFYLVTKDVDERETFTYGELGDPPLAVLIVLKEPGPETRTKPSGVSIAIFRPNGQSLTRIEGRYSSVLGCAAGPDAREVVVFAEDGKFLRALTIDLSNFEIRRNQELVRY
jgi:hypothetical protein